MDKRTEEAVASDLPGSLLDAILKIQIAVAAAGGRWDDGTGLHWWRSRLADDFGGVDLFQRLAPAAGDWSVLDVVRRAAKSYDRRCRTAIAGTSGRLRTVFWLGGELEELLDRRLRHHKTERNDARLILGADVQVGESFDGSAFRRWLEGLHGEEAPLIVAGGRELKSPPLHDPLQMAKRLAAALLPLPDHYPVPFFRVPME